MGRAEAGPLRDRISTVRVLLRSDRSRRPCDSQNHSGTVCAKAAFLSDLVRSRTVRGTFGMDTWNSDAIADDRRSAVLREKKI